jgi:hypothetical protein
VNPDSIFGYQQGLNNFNASIFGTQANIFNTQQANSSSPMGAILGGLAGSITGGIGTSLGSSAGGVLGKKFGF